MVTLEQERRVDGRLLLRLKGRFDASAAGSLSRRLDAAAAWSVVIDFAAVEAIEDASMNALAEALRRHAGHVALSGLRDHHLRLLGYLGVGGTQP
jgi:anti-anti-sigma regulatory factor